MTIEDPDSAEPAGLPHSRRGERRTPPIIEGAALDITEPSVQADDPLSAPDAGAEPAGGAEPTRRSRPRGDRLALAALALSLLALVAVGALWMRTLYGSESNVVALGQTRGLEARIDALNERTGAAIDLRQRVAALDATATSAEHAAEAARAQANKALDAASNAAQTTQRAAAAAARPATAAASPSAIDLDAMSRRVAALEQRSDPAAALTRLSSRMDGLDQGAGTLRDSLARIDKRLSDLAAKVAAEADRLPPLEALLNVPKVDAVALQASNAQAVNDAQAAALVVVARSIQQAVESGGPFARETAAAAKLGADANPLQALQASAANGVATTPELAQSFSALVGPVLAGIDGNARGGAFDRLASEFGKLVQIRTVGETAGNEPAAIVGRMETGLARGDVAAALKAREGLPGPAKTITETWATRARARVAAQDAARALLEDAISRVGKART